MAFIFVDINLRHQAVLLIDNLDCRNGADLGYCSAPLVWYISIRESGQIQRL